LRREAEFATVAAGLLPLRGSMMTKAKNPLLAGAPVGPSLPPFAAIDPAHFPPAFAEAMARHKAEIDKIAGATSKPTFANTILALEKSGRLLDHVASVFFNLTGAASTPALQEVERDIAPKLAAHQTAVLLNAALFARIDDLYQRRDRLKLDAEQRRVLELHHLWLVRAGARLKPKAKARVAKINERLATLTTEFCQNVLVDEQGWQMVLEDEASLAGLPEGWRQSAAQAGAEAGMPGRHVVTLARGSVEGFLQFSARRDLREEAWRAWTSRGEHAGQHDNRPILAEIVALRTELAKLFGYDTYAAYSLEETMAKTPEAVRGLIGAVWPKALSRVAEEKAALAEVVRAEGGNYKVAPWDWRYLAERVRRERFDLDDAKVRPFLALDNMIAASFDTASRLFGLKFKERRDLAAYHPDVRAWEVKDGRGRHVGLFLGDYFARTGKRSGAWMSSYRSQHKLGAKAAPEVAPIIVNVLNIPKPPAGEPALLSMDEAKTLFHEFGHGLHGLLSNVIYPSISGTSVVRDFVELPSQLYENWLTTRDVMNGFALHAKSGKPMPAALMKKLEAARHFNQGFATVEYAACAALDMDLHARTDEAPLDVSAFERDALKAIGMPGEVVMRHRLPHFQHIVGGYAAGYYSYLWSEVMDADAFAAFEETGDVFDAGVARRLKEYIYSAGNKRDPMAAYVAFRGRAPDVAGLVRKRGLA
jgi:peptidyl-dipeptidase Dcp